MLPFVFWLPLPAQKTEPQKILHTIREIRQLNNTQAKNKDLVDVIGVVTYSDPEWGLLFIYQQGSSIYVNVHGSAKHYWQGTKVRVTGVVAPGDLNPIIDKAQVEVLGHLPPPAAVHKSVAEIDAGVEDSLWVTTEGILHPCNAKWKRVCYRLFDGEKLIWVVSPAAETAYTLELNGARVRVSGVNGIHLDDNNHRAGAQLFVNDLNDLEILTPSPAANPKAPITPIETAKAKIPNGGNTPRIHVQGVVTWENGNRFFIQDGTRGLFVITIRPADVHKGNLVDVLGYMVHGTKGPMMIDAIATAASQTGDQKLPEALHVTPEAIFLQHLSSTRVSVDAHLIREDDLAQEYKYELESNGYQFNAILPRRNDTRESVILAPNSWLRVTGIAVIQNGRDREPNSLQILIDSPSDLEVQSESGWLTWKRAAMIFGAIQFFVIASWLWIWFLRRTVRKQTSIIRSKLEKELQLEKRYKRLFERNLAAVFTWKADGTILEWNRAFVRMLGLQTDNDMMRRNYWEMAADASESEQLRYALDTGSLSNFEGSLRRDDGTILHLLQNITPVESEDGAVYETTAIDVSQLKRNQNELQQARDTAIREALIDSLTDLPNRRHLMDLLSSNLDRARHEGLTLALLYLDLDGFKLVNDSLGHSVGDALLVQVAGCLRSWIRTGDILGRLGGDEFLVILVGLREKQDAVMVAENLLDAIRNPFNVNGHELAIGASVGISIYPDDSRAAEELVQQADSAMYVAKRAGKNRAASYTPEIGLQVHERSTLEHLLRGSISRREIVVHYQPEYELSTNRLVRFEALARWTHPTIGEVSPAKFIPIAEESGLIGALGALVMEKACNEARSWQEHSEQPIQVAVNVSGIQLSRKDFASEVGAILERSGLRPDLLQIEVTESAMIDQGEQAVSVLNQLKEMGISLAIDDFGTGYSNLSYLPSLPFDTLKIDGAFVRSLEAKPENESMVRTMVLLAHNIGLRVVVECVETEAQLGMIRGLNADEGQGYFLGRPDKNPLQIVLQSTASIS